jgi:hypothetical protein
VAARRPDAYDAIRKSLDATTRADISFQSGGDPDPAERQAWGRKHADGWAAAARGDTSDRSWADPQERGRKRRLFGRFRFPAVPYETVQSEFTREAPPWVV